MLSADFPRSGLFVEAWLEQLCRLDGQRGFDVPLMSLLGNAPAVFDDCQPR